MKSPSPHRHSLSRWMHDQQVAAARAAAYAAKLQQQRIRHERENRAFLVAFDFLKVATDRRSAAARRSRNEGDPGGGSTHRRTRTTRSLPVSGWSEHCAAGYAYGISETRKRLWGWLWMSLARLDFRLAGFDGAGRRFQLGAVRLEGPGIEGTVRENDWVLIIGRQSEGVMWADLMLVVGSDGRRNRWPRPRV